MSDAIFDEVIEPFHGDEFDLDEGMAEFRRMSLMSRQADLIPDRISEMSFLMIGLGSIGSNAAYTLASMGATRFDLWDPDIVELGNVFPSRYSIQQVGLPKVSAMQRILTREMGLDAGNVQVYPEYFGLEEPPQDAHYDVVVCSPDSLEARREMWALAEELGLYDLWVDGRMGGTSLTVYGVLASDEELKMRYNRSLQGGGFDLPCGQKATALLTKGMIPQLISQAVYDFALGEKPQYGSSYDASNRHLVTFNR